MIGVACLPWSSRAIKNETLHCSASTPPKSARFSPLSSQTIPARLVEGERVFVVENPGKDDSKKLTTGVLSKADQKEIVSDVKLSYPGAALFNSSGAVVGIIQSSGKGLRISPIAVAQPIIQEAKQKFASSSAPSPHPLPTPPIEDFPADQIRASGRGTWEKEVYSFKTGDFSVELVDPISSYEADNERYQRALKDYAKHPKGKVEPTEPEHKYSPVLIVVAMPQTKTSWGRTILSSMAAGPYSTSPTYKHYKTGFKRLRMLCGEKEVEPAENGGRPFQLEDYRALSLLRARTFNHSPWGYDVQISPALPCISGWSRTSLLVPNLMMSNPTGILQPQEQQIGSFPTSEGVFPIFKEAPCAGLGSVVA